MAVLNLTGLTRADLEILVSPAVWEQGCRAHELGYLITALRMDTCLAGIVLGNQGHYRARLWIADATVHGDCSCPYPGFCKHLVALALGWLEQRRRFHDLQPELERLLRQSEDLPQMLRHLATQDPINFWETFSGVPGQTGTARDNRQLIALIRQVFDRPVLTRPEVELLWERLQRVRYWLAAQLPQGGSELLGPLCDLFQGALREYQATRHDLLRNYLADLLQLWQTLPQYYATGALIPLFQTICDVYFNPEHWELTEDLRRVLAAFIQKDPRGYRAALAAKLVSPLPLVAQIAWYELLTLLPRESGAIYQLEYQQVTAALRDGEGRWWLIDRLVDTDRRGAQELLTAGLRQAVESERPAWRERLIRLHLLHVEWRQAAALIMEQFSDGPSFEEYLRLKACLAGRYPEDWERCRQQIRRLLTDRSDRELWLRIVIDRLEPVLINDGWDEIAGVPALLDCLVERLNERPLAELATLYPAAITALLARENTADWQRAGQTAVTFKKLCYQQRLRQQWETCRRRLLESDAARLKVLKRFGALLSS
ncbi:MAG: hypothetical protein PVH64_03400 [Bacillota bacterium]